MKAAYVSKNKQCVYVLILFTAEAVLGIYWRMHNSSARFILQKQSDTCLIHCICLILYRDLYWSFQLRKYLRPKYQNGHSILNMYVP